MLICLYRYQPITGKKGQCKMDITKEYLVLFNAITDIEQALESLRLRLIATQQEAEELYISRSDEDDS